MGTLPERLAAAILAYAREAGLPVGAPLREQALAERFRVSRSPVRAALAILQGRGVVEHRPNRGCYLRWSGPALPPAPAARIDDDADYERIAEDRLAGALPERISEAALMRRYGLSRSRLVMLLARMAEEGWAERLPGHGWRFRPLLDTVAAYEAGYLFRATIEPAALLLPGFRADPAELARLRAEQEMLLAGGIGSLPLAELFRINAGFHETLVDFGGNPFFSDAIRRVNRLRRLVEYRTFADASRLVAQGREHLALLDLVARGDMARAAAALKRHLDGVRATKLGSPLLRDALAPRRRGG